MTAGDRNTTSTPSVNRLAVASLVFGILWLMWVGSILALVFGYVAKSRIDRSTDAQEGRGLAVAGIVLGWIGVGTLAVMATMVLTDVADMPDMPMMNRFSTSEEFSSNGERIYMTATNDAGEAITYQGGPGDGMPRGMIACADCHGPDGRGGERQMMMETFYAPDIRWSTLTGDHAQPYARQTLRAAITEGIGSGDRPLSKVMPRWQLSPDDLTDLLSHLQTLGE